MGKHPKFRNQPIVGRHPVAGAPVATSKLPKSIYDGDAFYSQRPAWRISMLQVIDPFGWHELGAPKILEIRQKLANFESMTWQEILVKAKKRNHLVPVAKLCSQAREHLLVIRQHDIDEMVSLRLMSTERIWGILEQSVLKILWWDPEHLVCPSLLKHT